MARRTKRKSKSVETITHDGAKRRNIPTAEYQPMLGMDDQHPIQVAYQRRNPDLDPQLVWRGKDMQDWSDLVVPAPPLFIQEKVHPKVLIDDLVRRSRTVRKEQESAEPGFQANLFGDFNGLPDDDAKTEFYRHDANWSNRMILGDSLQVMASLAEREGLRGKVQCIYVDPPYGIKFNSNFQWSTTSRDVRDTKAEHVTREPEQVKAYRDTWRDGVHSYLTYLRDRLTVARDLLNDSGSIFVQIGDENVHRVRAVMDEIFGPDNFVSEIHFQKTGSAATDALANVVDHIVWFCRDRSRLKYRQLYNTRALKGTAPSSYNHVLNRFGDDRSISRDEQNDIATLGAGDRLFQSVSLESEGPRSGDLGEPYVFRHNRYTFRSGAHWKTHHLGLSRLGAADRVHVSGNRLRFRMLLDDYPVKSATNVWSDVMGASGMVYVVQTSHTVVQRCILMATDPGDLVLDPTCGAGTTPYVAEQWGRRWITIDTSRVALALARSRIMGTRFPWYILADSADGQRKEAELSLTAPSERPTYGDVRHGFVHQRAPHITLRSIANNAEIDTIYEAKQPSVEAALLDLNAALQGHPTPLTVETGGRKGKEIDFLAPSDATVELPSGESAPAGSMLEWEVPREPAEDWNDTARDAHARFWEARIARQREIDASIAARAEYETLYDKPYEDRTKTRVAGPFTVESLSPHRLAAFDENDELIVADAKPTYIIDPDAHRHDFGHMVLENLRTAGVQQARKAGRITFSSLEPWPGDLVCAEGRYLEGGDTTETAKERRAGIFIGPEFGTVARHDLVRAVREAADANFDALIACAFNYDAHATEFNKLGRIPILKARMNADLHMAEDLKKTNTANLFVIFGEPDIDILPAAAPTPSPNNDEQDWLQVKIKGVDIFDPSAGEVRSDDTDGIACWFVDTDYNEESFFVRQAYFLGANDPYKSLKTTLRAEIDPEAWQSLNSDTSHPFPKPTTGRIAVKVINHLGDEVMKVFGV